jgi:predicted transcriptional regulator
MARKPSSQLTPLELEIMEVLWATGPASVQTVVQGLEREYAHTTIHTMLNVLVRKGKVKRQAKDRAHVYRAVVSRAHVVTQAVRDVADKLFGGSTVKLMMNVMESPDLTADEVALLRKRLEEISRDADE